MSYKTFKKGDRVRVHALSHLQETLGVKIGMVGTCLEDSPIPYVKIDGWHNTDPDFVRDIAFNSGNIELIGEAPTPKFKVGDTGRTRAGYTYRVIKTDHEKVWKGREYPIIAAIRDETDDDAFRTFTADGTYCVGDACDWDLMPPANSAQAGPSIAALSAAYRAAHASHAAAIERTLAARAAHAEAEEAEEAAEVAEQQAAAALLASIDAA